jgi:hypothetical protein
MAVPKNCFERLGRQPPADVAGARAKPSAPTVPSAKAATAPMRTVLLAARRLEALSMNSPFDTGDGGPVDVLATAPR